MDDEKHSVGCLYEYALARLGLSDSPDLRVIFWDAHDSIVWDEATDWYVLPERGLSCALCSDREELNT